MARKFNAVRQENASQSGFVLIVVMIALVATAGYVAVLQSVAVDKNQFATAESSLVDIESFAQSVLSLCPSVIEAARREGEYQAVGLQAFDTFNDFPRPPVTSQVMDPDLAQQLMITSATSSDWENAIFRPDLVVGSGAFSAAMDIDLYIPAGSASAYGGIKETYQNDTYAVQSYGAADAGSGSEDSSTVQTFRCFVSARDNSTVGREVSVYAFYRK